jgi:ribonuclease HI
VYFAAAFCGAHFADTIRPMPKKQFYVVVKGRRPGIYEQWSGETGAQAQVSGYPGAVFMGFATRAEAERYLQSGGRKPAARPAALPAIKQATSQPPSQPVRAASSQAYAADLAAGKTVIFTDGASTGNPGPGGYGVVMMHGDARQELSGGFRCTTNNRMELTGVIVALQALEHSMSVVVYSDSRYVVDAVEKGWARRWRSRGWMRNSEDRAENSDLWAALLNLLEKHQVEFRWVRGHASNPENERCDLLAVKAAHEANLPVDSGYQGKCR